MKRILVFVLIAIMAIGMCGCSKPEQSDEVFFGTDDTKSGGTPMENVNLSNISVIENGDHTDIVFDFVQGSQTAEGSVSAIKGLPEYYVSFCENPTRLVLGMKNLMRWDYQQNSVALDEAGLVQGCFLILPAGSRRDYQLYLNLSSDVTFKTKEEDGKLTISLKKSEKLDETCYYVYGDLINEYRQGALSDELGLTPTLADDHSEILMISRAFPTQLEAEEFKQMIETEYSLVLGEKSLKIYSTDNGELPRYVDSEFIDELRAMMLINRNGIEEGGTVFYPDGRPLCFSNDSKKAIFARKEISGNNDVESETMFVVDENGSKSKLFISETTSIAQAMFSPDDKNLLYIEQINGVMLASIYNFEDNKLAVVDEEQLGTFITGAAWAQDSSCVYFLAGEELPNLKKYNVTTGAITTISQDYFIESELYCANGNLYFNTVQDDEEALVEFNVETGEKTTLTFGEYFSLDKKGEKMLIKRASNSQEGKDALVLFDIQSKTEKIIVQDVILSMYFFAADGTQIYYSVDNGEQEPYVQTVFCYSILDGNVKELFKSVKAKISVSYKTNELLVQTTYTKNDELYPATFKVITH